jgi:hypothetical protein
VLPVTIRLGMRRFNAKLGMGAGPHAG